MSLILKSDEYLISTEIIDWLHADVKGKARDISADAPDETTIAKRCFEFVRDCIRHSHDYRLNPVTCSASEVLAAGTGYCYSKSHLLAALLRANGLPAGLCYQRLRRDGVDTPLVLHGLVAVHLPDTGWYRIDPRGNISGVDTQFAPPVEKLAYSPVLPGEADLPGVLPDPLPAVADALRSFKTWDALYANLPE